MAYKIEDSKWGPYIMYEGERLWYDFFLDKSTWAKDLPKTVDNPKITYSMLYIPEADNKPSTLVLGSRTIEGLEEELRKVKESTLKESATKPNFEEIKETLDEITTEGYKRRFLLK